MVHHLGFRSGERRRADGSAAPGLSTLEPTRLSTPKREHNDLDSARTPT